MNFSQECLRHGVVCNYGIADCFKAGYLSVDFVMPLNEENATSMSLLAGVLSRGCQAYPRMDMISRYLARHYGASYSATASKAGEMEILSLSFLYLNNEFAIDQEDVQGSIIHLLKEMLERPLVQNGGFMADYVEQEKANLKDKIKGIFNDKRIYSLERCKELMCENEAFGIGETGRLSYLETIDAHSLYAFFEKMLKQAQIILSYVGKDQGSFLSDVADLFEARPVEMPQTAVSFTPVFPREFIEEMDLNQSKLNLGFRLGKTAMENGEALRLFNVLYGASANSKLFMNVRERLSLCYYCSSVLDRFKNVMFVSSGVESEKYEEAKAEIVAQLKAVAAGDFTDEEFENAKIYLIDSICGMADSQGALASVMLGGTLRGKVLELSEEIELIRQVDRETVIRIAQEIQLDTVYLLKGVHNEK